MIVTQNIFAASSEIEVRCLKIMLCCCFSCTESPEHVQLERDVAVDPNTNPEIDAVFFYL